jgi:uncharacterized protein YfaQ (DUF2300 family)
MLCVVFLTSRFFEKNPNMILGDEPLLSQGGSITVGTRAWFGGKHTSKHIKLTIKLSVRNG